MLVQDQIEAHRRIAHSIAAQKLQHMSILGTSAAHKFEAGRHIVEEIADSDGCAMRTSAPSPLHHFYPTPHYPQSRMLLAHRFRLNRPAQHGRLRDCSDTG